jgi:hypothetical protein
MFVMDDILSRLSILISEYGDSLPSERKDSIVELIQVSEYGIAFENLCSELYEYDVKVSRESLVLISEIGNKMGISSDCWSMLC